MIQDRISAGGNLLIDAGHDQWRLLIHSGGVERVLMEVLPGQPIRYAAVFGTQRRLPASNSLPTEIVQRVAVGWSNRDEAWHVGLVLEPDLANERGSRWCEIAHFPDAEANLYGDVAAQAGERLAALINRPYSFVEPDTSAPRPAVAPDVNLPAPPLTYPLPIKLDYWTLTQQSPAQFELVRTGAWSRSKFVRSLWYLVLAIAFILLSTASITSGIALPRIGGLKIEAGGRVWLDIPAPPPETLIIVGYICAALLIVLALISLIRMISAVKRISIDGEMRLVRGMKGRRAVWSVPASELDSVYASVVVSRFNPKRNPTSRKAFGGEVSLHHKSGDFTFLAGQNSLTETISVNERSTNEENITPLTTHSVPTAIHAAALYIARALDLPARYDQRVK